ncbi:penicillin-binding protein activator [Utexia brackfieldae]|uniref:penicillin-binding protein activator n=1 Tax=Utexia brackfieldae TaxID=3074108 RepID=UPI00370D6956
MNENDMADLLNNKCQKNKVIIGSRWIKIVITILLVAFAVGCTMVNKSAVPVKNQVYYDDSRGSAYYLTLMQNEMGSTKTDLQLMYIRALLAENRLTDAQQQLLELVDLSLNAEQIKEKKLNAAELAVKSQTPIDLSQSIDTNTLSIQQQSRYYQIKLLQDQQGHDINAAVRDYVILETLGFPATRHQVINDTWRYLNALSDDDLASILVYANEAVLQGWVQLAYAYRNSLKVDAVQQLVSDGSVEMVTPTLSDEERAQRIHAAIAAWQMQYPTHPAALYLPQSIYGDDAASTNNQQGKRVALFLPLQGTSKVFGEVLRAGYMEAARFYPNEPGQNVMVFDTTSAPLPVLVKQAQEQGAEMIVGPLLKNDVALISQLNTAIPVLALNKINDDNQQTSAVNANICYFGLSPEDEAADAAKHIFAQGKNNPLIITVQSDLGRRVANAFVQQWHQLTSSDVYVQYFNSAAELKQKMNSGVGLQLQGDLLASQVLTPNQTNQANIVDLTAVNNTSNTNQSVTASHAIDAIYAFATQEELEFIKPMLDMKAADDENPTAITVVPPIYTSSRSNSANTSTDYRFEMDRVQFSDMPLLVDDNDILSQLPKNIQQDYSLARLYAMGIDAWRLANQFQAVQTNNQADIDGVTGQIIVSPGCQINRALTWKIYRQGKVLSAPQNVRG